MTTQPGLEAPSRRKLDAVLHPHAAPDPQLHADSAPMAGQARPGHARSGHARRWLGGLASRGRFAWLLPPPAPPELRATLAAPFFEANFPLFAGHGGTVVLSALTAAVAPTGFHLLLVWANLCILAWRVRQVLRAGARIRAEGSQAAAPLLPGYQLTGYVWSGLNGLLCAQVVLAGGNDVLRVLATTFAVAVSAGICSRNAGAPGFSMGQIALWLLPTIAADCSLGGVHTGLGAAVLLFGATMASIVRRQHIALVKMIVLERTSAALAARFDAALSNMSQGLVLYDKEGALRVINRRFFAIFGLPPGCLQPGQRAADVMRACLSAGALNIRRATQLSLEAYAQDGPVRGVLALEDGRSVAVSCEELPDGGSISTYEDITERRASEARIAHMAMHDALTGMPNRALFKDRLDQAVARLSRGECFGLACLDLDHFKAVNDTLGHNMGDKLLQAVAHRLACCVREVDLVARLGGDEFAILLPGLERDADAQIVAKRLIETVRGAYHIDGATMTIGVSIGLAIAPRDGSGAEALMMHADLAMYAAKGDGRGGVRIFESDLSVKLAARQAMERDLAEALEADSLEVRYVPIHCTRTDAVTALQAVACWPHPTRGLLTDEQFMPHAQDRGLQTALGTWLLRQACAHAAIWPTKVCLAVRLSPAQLRCGELLRAIPAQLSEAGLAPSRLEIEIQEAALQDGADAVLAGLRALRALGVRIALDNFGAGLSCLSRPEAMVFDKIRIGSDFIEHLDRSDSAAAIVGAIVGLGHNLGLATGAHGAHSDAHRDMLRRLGCDEAQGRASCAPRSIAEVGALLARV